ncbi:MAG: polynucleotide adenylyltransferase PcnB [Gammaproteobacteria bacterium]|nr:polynucleotide adenylyltransferase PcnB [Gammaproteobacteria bacterium]
MDNNEKKNAEKCIYPRPDHIISRSNISPNAVKVLYRLNGAGFEAFLVGGGVRDLLLERKPKDFDVTTNATPEDVRALFRNCRLIGRRFRLAHVHFGSEIIEVATFRGQHEGDQGDEGQIVDGMIVRDNVYGSLEEDAWRRDFSVNSLYYNVKDFSVEDHVGGLADLKAKKLRILGDPEARYREDPVRMLRAVRFAAKLDFTIDAESEAPLFELGGLLEGVPPARLFEEVLKLFLSGHAVKTLELLRRYNLFHFLFPQTEVCLKEDVDGVNLAFINRALENTDSRVAEGKPVTPAFIFAVFLWQPVVCLRAKYLERGMSESQTMTAAADAVMSGQSRRISIPRRFHTPMRDIWHLQDRFLKRAPKRSIRLLTHPRFRAGYDFLLLRAEVGDAEVELAQWWTSFYDADESGRGEITDKLSRGRRQFKRRKSKSNTSPGTE